jgi:nitroimidazol reductase NimA-like FMN-containing flavoprotein (pyridoxamine 5'-phosphate oxidase superfamily)
MMRELATDQLGLEILHLGDCFRLLASVSIGRIAFTSGGEVLVLPVIFLVDGQDVVFRAKTGSKLASVEVGQYVAFEVDSYDAAADAGWSVVVRGLAEVQSEAECARLDTLGMKAWGGSAEERAWVRIRPAAITGRQMAVAAGDGAAEHGAAEHGAGNGAAGKG